MFKFIRSSTAFIVSDAGKCSGRTNCRVLPPEHINTHQQFSKTKGFIPDGPPTTVCHLRNLGYTTAKGYQESVTNKLQHSSITRIGPQLLLSTTLPYAGNSIPLFKPKVQLPTDSTIICLLVPWTIQVHRVHLRHENIQRWLYQPVSQLVDPGLKRMPSMVTSQRLVLNEQGQSMEISNAYFVFEFQ